MLRSWDAEAWRPEAFPEAPSEERKMPAAPHEGATLFNIMQPDVVEALEEELDQRSPPEVRDPKKDDGQVDLLGPTECLGAWWPFPCPFCFLWPGHSSTPQTRSAFPGLALTPEMRGRKSVGRQQLRLVAFTTTTTTTKP